MVQPDFATFSDMARQGNLIPVYREILGDLETPVSAYKKLRGAGLFLSVGERRGRREMGPFQFSGAQPLPAVSGAGRPHHHPAPGPGGDPGGRRRPL